jgi:hypothetical protein
MRGFLCGWTSVIVPAFFVGFAVATAAGSDFIGWLAALVVGAAYQVRAGRSATCAIPPAPAASAEDEPATTSR